MWLKVVSKELKERRVRYEAGPSEAGPSGPGSGVGLGSKAELWWGGGDKQGRGRQKPQAPGSLSQPRRRHHH